MDWQYLLFLSLVPVTLTALIISMTLAWRWRRTKRGRSLLLLQSMVLLWLLSNTLELLAPSELLTLFFAKLTYIFIILTPVAWLYFSMVYTGFSEKFGRELFWIGVIPAISLIGVFTNPYHHLMWQDNIYRSIFGFIAISHTYGPLFYVHTVYSYLLFFGGIGVIVYSIYNGPSIYRKQLNAFMFGTSIVISYNLLHILKVLPIQKDFSPILLALPGLALVFSMLRYRLLEIQPLSRDTLLDFLPDGIVITNPAHRIIDINVSGQQILGINGDKPPIGDLFEIHFPEWVAYTKQASGSESLAGSFKWTSDNGQNERIYQVDVNHLKNGSIVTFHEITATEMLLGQIQELASRDPLTGVFNRREFFLRGEAALSLAIRHQRPLSVMLLDIDHFKQFNDQFGHQLGDSILVTFAEYCFANFRKSDILARYGGDEFVALLPETNVEQAASLARRINKEIKTIWQETCGPDCHLGLSIGLAEYSEMSQEINLDQLIDRADQALYKTKELGRDGHTVWNPVT
jgi:diguanylate cyclase (GGDEF)-like protein